MKEIISILLEIKNGINVSHLQGKEVLTLQEFSFYSDITLNHCYKLTQQRLIPYSRPGKKIYIDREDAIAYLKQNPVLSKSGMDQKIQNILLNTKTSK